MIIGIDISQIVYKGTGVGRYVEEIVSKIISQDDNNSYILFGSSLRQRNVFVDFYNNLSSSVKHKITLKVFPFPPSILDLLWNRLHIAPIEWFIGPVDIFWSSDWTQPPLNKAKGITTIHDLTIFKFPESFPEKIVTVHKRKLVQSKKECSYFLCESAIVNRASCGL